MSEYKENILDANYRLSLVFVMDLDIKSRIYQAQCIGNVEPIEYMIPYPSMRSLIEGQNIKYAEQIIIKDRNITNQTFYNYVQQTSHWLETLGLEPKERMIIPDLGYPQTEILLYGIWNLGAIGVLAADVDKKAVSYTHLRAHET